jgi:nickel transport protein
MTTHQAFALVGAAALLLAPTAAGAHGIETDLRRFDGLSSRLDFGDQRPGGPQVATPQAATPHAATPQATPQAEGFQLRSNFSTGAPAVAAAVRLLPPDGGEPIEVGRTDANGQISFTLPEQAGADWEIQVDAGPGHRDYLELAPTEESAVPLVPSPSAVRRPVRDAVRDVMLSLRDSSGGRVPGLLVLGMVGSLGGLLWRRHRS